MYFVSSSNVCLMDAAILQGGSATCQNIEKDPKSLNVNTFDMEFEVVVKQYTVVWLFYNSLKLLMILVVYIQWLNIVGCVCICRLILCLRRFRQPLMKRE